MKVYCYNCSEPNLYETAKPKFCQACGQPIDGSTAKVVPKPAVKPARKPIVVEEVEAAEEHVPNISSLSVEIVKAKPAGTNFGDLALDKGERNRIDRPQMLVSAEQVLKDFQQEAGPVKRSHDVGGSESNDD